MGLHAARKSVKELRDYVQDLNYNKVIKLKFDGYDPGPLNYMTSEPYTDDPRQNVRKLISYVFFGLLALLVITGFLVFFYRNKWRKSLSKSR